MTAVIVIPAFNEAKSIADVVASVRGFGDAVVVDDGSADDTAARAARAGATVVSHRVNRGYDAAITSGFERACQMGADAIVTFDADGQLEAASIPVALQALADGHTALALGVRESGAARISERLFNLYARLRFGVPDILCGLKGVRTDEYQARGRGLREDSVNTALALVLLRHEKKFALVPVAVRPRDGEARYGNFWRANWSI